MTGPAKMWAEIVCHECSVSGPGQFVRGGRIPVRELTNEANKQGWRQRTSGDYECPKCKREILKRLENL